MSISIVLTASALFFLSELSLIIIKRSKKNSTKVSKDQFSLILFWVCIPLSLSIGFYIAKYSTWTTMNKWIATTGLVVFSLGLIIRWISIVQLKKQFTVDVAIVKDHQLRTNGIYSMIRHPSYLGLWLCCLGLSLSMNSLISFLVITISIFAVILYRIKIEERILVAEFGADYETYRAGSYKLIPWIY